MLAAVCGLLGFVLRVGAGAVAGNVAVAVVVAGIVAAVILVCPSWWLVADLVGIFRRGWWWGTGVVDTNSCDDSRHGSGVGKRGCILIVQRGFAAAVTLST